MAPAAAPGDASPQAPPGFVSAGRVGRPHGLDGSFYVTRPRARLLAVVDQVHVAGAPRPIDRRTGTDAKPLLRLAGVASREAIDALRGEELYVPRQATPDLPEDEYWPEDLVGLTVRSRSGRPVGVVEAVRELPSCDVLEVRRPEGEELLVPLTHDAVPELDVAGGTATVDLEFLGEEEPAAGEGEGAAGPAEEPDAPSRG
ncbi:ribosome maturation factor RimM [Patulibacter defluvii]|uniref:ribosome maturation factor RimM n=1 Tax=Patulibacter defluvii TaxID=3095358 RepID=UPI002A75A8A1|nr:ribosome maturation factor RimM [Patulibacter sp. DM4]